MIRWNSKKLAFVALALTIALVGFLSPAPPSDAADHGDAPYNSSDQAVDGADTYAFVDPNDDTRVILAATVRGFIAAGENVNFGQFDPAVRHRFEIETTGDARADRFIDVTFAKRTGGTNPQAATITLMDGQTFPAQSVPPSNCIAGSANCPPAINTFISDLGTTGVRFFAGMRDDSFIFDIPAFGRFTTKLRACVAVSNPPAGACVADALTELNRGRDSFAGYNIMTIALSVPKSLFQVSPSANNTIGVQSVFQRRSPQIFPASPDVVRNNYSAVGVGRWQTLDRAGVPGINAVIIPFVRKDEFNASTPLDDAAPRLRFATDIINALTALGTNQTNINILAGVAVLNGDMLRLNLNTPNTSLGFGEQFHSTTNYAGFPNGRRPGDDVIDTLLFFIANQTAVSDNANQNEVPFLSAFPYFAPPHQPRPNSAGAEDQTRN